MIDNSGAWLTLAEEILQSQGPGGRGRGAEAAAYAVSMLAAVYGPESAQIKQLQTGYGAIQKTTEKDPRALDFGAYDHARGVIRNTVAELKAALTLRIRVAVASVFIRQCALHCGTLAASGLTDHVFHTIPDNPLTARSRSIGRLSDSDWKSVRACFKAGFDEE